MTFLVSPNINFGLWEVETLVTNRTEVIDQWTCNVAALSRSCEQVIVGWALERLKFCPGEAATLQLCVGYRCIIIQLKHLDLNIPDSLLNFLAEPNVVCAGVIEKEEGAKLFPDHKVVCVGVFEKQEVAELSPDHIYLKIVDIRKLGMKSNPGRLFPKSRLETLARVILNLQMPKPEVITFSNWERFNLDLDQVKYACLDAYVCYHVGNKLREFIPN